MICALLRGVCSSATMLRMNPGKSNPSSVVRRSESVAVLGDFLGDDERVLSHGAKAVSQVFGSVVVHGR
jgi:hypothetical protein